MPIPFMVAVCLLSLLKATALPGHLVPRWETLTLTLTQLRDEEINHHSTLQLVRIHGLRMARKVGNCLDGLVKWTPRMGAIFFSVPSSERCLHLS